MLDPVDPEFHPPPPQVVQPPTDPLIDHALLDISIVGNAIVTVRRDDGLLVKGSLLSPGIYLATVYPSKGKEKVLRFKVKAGEQWVIQCSEQACKAKRW